MFDGKKVLITGGTGSLGQALTKRLLKYDIDNIRIFSRNEHKQVEMESKFNDDRLRFFLGDVRDYSRLLRAIEDVDIVFHTAALKHVPKIEYNPFEGIKTNVIGSQNVIDACLEENVERVIAISTDKAVSPLNTYGATKVLMEKLFVSASNYSNPKKHRTKFITIRYGNVLGSSGSVIPVFVQQIKSNQKITITDPQMTRFSIMMEEALNFILKAAEIGKGSDIFLPKLRAYSIIDVKDVLHELLGDTGEEIIGIRHGEKLHEILINRDEIRYSWEIDGMYMIPNPIFDDQTIISKYPGTKHLKDLGEYSSDKVEKISKEELKTLIRELGIL
ncbi:SDR family NAD(P)-dependent oxidoreductase [Marine Group I thaumarchaeote]|uniref:SDR family NAD(P)-dependent oxidoreductase n=1 Tax=Marine Group I thaumarchaeote TaxID=2511932 RepID=A0A7K4MM56_9ARCH|nr:SDR family NAD(P)-dependent oxidoreductase [Marine Group I thaumarchaeote]